ncbi:YaaA family protein [Spelaeicoccus albus]|uniref:Peroxide stress protein YaaA n=1 Tax=Spelaeicoccus albus TaxID=1280376 RepID=A0A7Z0II97_9MICO|nr:peroxide stress protein YaaA [Spelaeicoccus albus]NYI68313.1 hypothetical protein [Spelaeicoccus albus]
MLILLPPSEGKTPATGKDRLDLAALTFPELTDDRRIVLEALVKVSAHEDALRVLGVGDTLTDQVQRNVRLDTEPVAPAHSVYSGVLYEALGYRSMTATAKKRADASILIVSALFGAVAPPDRIPAYRLSMGTNLPGLGRLSSWWKSRLAVPLTAYAHDQLVIDCRSSDYATAWKAPAGSVAVRVFRESGGKRTVVSHMAKQTRGELARHLLTRRGRAPQTPRDLLKIASTRWTAELQPPAGSRPGSLDLILPG